ncbi:MAG: hypothetical protein DRP93_08635 [Candidatus Neomarinimicrobiota bacterium]|nr:MAG: hypothetical protein DRP93_08635 [Candidatus Neomarinimicrobiota bacterium]
MKEKTLSEKIRESPWSKEGSIKTDDVKQFIKEILDLSDLGNFRGYSNIEKIMNKIKQKAGDLI